jgi:hypothetical protein
MRPWRGSEWSYKYVTTTTLWQRPSHIEEKMSFRPFVMDFKERWPALFEPTQVQNTAE